MISHHIYILQSVLLLLSIGFLNVTSALTCIQGYPNISNTTCNCYPGFEGAFCESIISTFCFHGGTSDSTISRCHCRGGYYGTHCELSSTIMHCHNGGHFNQTSMECECTSDYGGLKCEYIYCIHGTRNPNDVDHCICDKGYEGKHCDNIAHHYCFNNGKYDYHHHRCSCLPRFTGTHCETDLHCINGGVYNSTSNTCQCLTGWGGIYCEIISCDYGYPDDDFDKCICDHGYEGTHCDHIDHHFYHYCYNGGAYDHQRQRCHCLAPFAGTHCEKDLKCLNDGIYNTTSKTCQCLTRWSGLYCEIISCDHGHPDDDFDDCICDHGYEGDFCAGIRKDHCFHDGNYSHSEKICKCPSGYSGQHCEEEPDLCDIHPCKNGGRCYHDREGFVCVCTTGFTGLLCESDMTPVSNQVTTNCSCPITQTSLKSTTNYPSTFTTRNTATDCASFPCVHGICAAEKASFFCTCYMGYTGKTCEVEMALAASTPQTLIGLTVGALDLGPNRK